MTKTATARRVTLSVLAAIIILSAAWGLTQRASAADVLAGYARYGSAVHNEAELQAAIDSVIQLQPARLYIEIGGGVTLTKPLEIAAPAPADIGFRGSNVTLVSAAASRHINVSGPHAVALRFEGVALDGGNASGGVRANGALTLSGADIANCVFSGGDDSGGGGVYAAGALTIDSGSIIADCKSTNGGGIFASYTVKIDGAEIRGNTADTGGGIFTIGAAEVSGGAEIHGNTANVLGGGIFAIAKLDVDNAEISDNESGGNGGGVYALSHVALNAAELSGNEAGGNGGGVYSVTDVAAAGTKLDGNKSGGDGGAIWANAKAALDGGALTNNIAAANGGGVWSQQILARNIGTFALETRGTANFNGTGAETYLTLKDGEITGGISGNEAARGAAFYCRMIDTVKNNGNVTVDHCAFSGDGSDNDAGSVVGENVVAVTNSVFRNNMTTGINSEYVIGEKYALAVTVSDSLFIENTEYTSIYTNGDTDARISRCTFDRNEGTSGAVFSLKMTIAGSTFTGNKSTGSVYGGAVTVGSDGTATVTGSTFAGNQSPNGGAIYNYDNTYSPALYVSDSAFTGNTASAGGAIYGSAVNIKNGNVFSGNHATGDGGAVYSRSAAAIGENNTFMDNYGSQGGAVFAISSDIAVDGGNTFTGNHSNYGGALGVYGGKTEIGGGNAFTDNYANNLGGAVYVSGGTVDVGSGNTFTENHSYNDGGALCASSGKTGIGDGNTFAGNYTGSSGAGGAVYSSQAATIGDGNTFTENRGGYGGGAVYAAGITTGSGNEFTGNYTAGNGSSGGAVYVGGSGTGANFGSDNTFTGNRADGTSGNGGAVYGGGYVSGVNIGAGGVFGGNSAVNGGAVYLGSPGGAIRITGGTFTGNRASGAAMNSGGAVYINNHANLYLYGDTLFSGNTAAGGAVDWVIPGSGTVYEGYVAEGHANQKIGAMVTPGAPFGNVYNNYDVNMTGITVKYNVNGGSGAQIEKKVAGGSNVTMPAFPEAWIPPAHTYFVDWSTNSGETPGGGLAPGAATGSAPPDGETFYALYKSKITVTFKPGTGGELNGGAADVVLYVIPGEKLDFDEVFAVEATKTSHSFKQWAVTSGDSAGVIATGELVSAAQLASVAFPETPAAYTLTAEYEAGESTTLVLNYAGGTYGGQSQLAAVELNGDTAVPEPAREGYTFSGWDAEADNPAAIDISGGTFTHAGGGIYKYTARWAAVTYSSGATFKIGEADKGQFTGGSAADVTAATTFGAKIGDNATVPAAEGKIYGGSLYVFDGWQESGKIYNVAGVENYTVDSPAQLVFTAQWKVSPNAAAVFDFAGGGNGSGDGYVTMSGAPGGKYVVPAWPGSFSREGYAFAGWSGGTPDGTYGAAGSSTTYTATWTANKYNLKFTAGANGTAAADVDKPDVDFGTAMSAYTADVSGLAAPAGGYAFVGWDNSHDGRIYSAATNPAFGAYTMPGSDVTFTSVFAPLGARTVLFDYAGGLDGDGNGTKQIAGTGGSVSAPAGLAKPGYTRKTEFGGWNVQPAATFGELAENSLTTYTAQWESVGDLAVTFALGTGQSLAPNDGPGAEGTYTVRRAYGVKAGAAPAAAPQTDYAFSGWLCSADNLLYTASLASAYKVTQAVTFTAQYADSTKGTVILNYSGGIHGGNYTLAMSGTAGGAIGAMPDQPAREGYAFTGWSPALTAATQYPAAGTVKTYTAQWTAVRHIVTFSAGEHGAFKSAVTPSDYSQHIENGKKLAAVPEVDPETGYTFKGWSQGGADVFSAAYIKTLAVSANVTYTAQYEQTAAPPAPEEFTLTLVFGANSLLNNFGIIRAKDSLIDLADYENIVLPKPGYQFAGWYADAQFSGPPLANVTLAADTNVYAKIVPDTATTYTATFDLNGGNRTGGGELTQNTLTYGQFAAVPEFAPPPDKVFKWWTDNGGAMYGSDTVNARPVTANVTYTAQYGDAATAVYSVHFNSNASYGAVTLPHAITGLQPGETAALATFTVNPAPNGYTFNGWSLTDGGALATSVTIDLTNPLDADVWAVYERAAGPFTVTFKDKDGIAIENGTFTNVPLNDTVTAPVPPAAAGKTFGHWLDGDGIARSGAAVNALPITKDYVFTAQYAEDDTTVTLTFDVSANSGFIGPAGVDAPLNTEIQLNRFVAKLKPDAGNKDAFTGWSLTSGGTAATSVTLNESKTAYAKFAAPVSVTFKQDAANLDSVLAAQEVKYGGYAAAPPDPADGANDPPHPFVGWTTGGSGATIYPGGAIPYITIAADTTFSAVYGVNGEPAGTWRTVTFDKNGGVSAPAGILLRDGEDLDLADLVAAPDNGRTFAGWITDRDDESTTITGISNINADKTLYALYAKLPSVKFIIASDDSGKGAFGPQSQPASLSAPFVTGAGLTMLALPPYSESGDTAKSVAVGSDGTIPAAALPAITDKPGHTHVGWILYDGNAAQFYLLKDVPPYIRIDSDAITFVAVFDAAPVPPHTVTYVSGGKIVKTEQVAHGSTGYNQPLTSSLAVPSGKQFRFWSADGTTEHDFSTPVTGDMTIAAIWADASASGGGGGGTVEKEKEAVQESGYGISDKLKLRLETVKHIPYLNGYEDGTVHPDAEITRAEVAAIFFRLSKTQNAAAGSEFTDVEPAAWYAPAVNFLANEGVLTGYGDGTFCPERSITRAEFATIASRFDDLTDDVTNAFTDVTETHWAYKRIISAYAKGWISGYPGGEFLPDNAITRAEAVTIVNKMLARGVRISIIDASLRAKFSDLRENHWAFAGIIEASAAHDYDRDEDGFEIWKY